MPVRCKADEGSHPRNAVKLGQRQNLWDALDRKQLFRERHAQPIHNDRLLIANGHHWKIKHQ
ncbi:hypothetical protein DEA98_05115 [Brucella pseudogrignonensis]|nr:hypothetical protein [Brucella pseudogrignonensis]